MDNHALSCHILLHDNTIFPDLASLKDDTCYICLETCSNSPKGETAVKLPCGHVFGLSCIAEWTRGMEYIDECTCPMCRQPYGTVSDHRLISWLTCPKPIHNMMHELLGAEERVFASETWKQLTTAITGVFALIQQQTGGRSAFSETAADRELVEAVKGNLRVMSRCCKRGDSGLDNIRSMVDRQVVIYEGVLIRLGVGELLREPTQTGMSKEELLQDWW